MTYFPKKQKINLIIGLFFLLSSILCTYSLRFIIVEGDFEDIWIQIFIISLIFIIGTLNIIYAFRNYGGENYILLFISTLSMMLFIDFFFYPLIDKEMFRANFAEARGIEYDARKKIEVLIEKRINKEKVYPAIYPNRIDNLFIQSKEVSILGGISNERTVYCNENGEYILYDSDEHGFRNPKGLYDGKLQVALIGDSFVHGACVRDQEMFSAHIRSIYPKTLSFATSANGSLRNLALLKEFVAKHTPQTVLWFFTAGNDLIEQQKERENPVLVKYLSHPNHKQGLSELQPEIDRHLREFANDIIKEETLFSYYFKKTVRALFLVNTVQHIEAFIKRKSSIFFLGNQVPDTLDLANEHAYLRLILQEAQNVVSEWSGKLVTIYNPSQSIDLNKRSSHMSDDTFKKLTQELGIPMINLRKMLVDADDQSDLYALGLVNSECCSSHYNASGYKKASEIILKNIGLK